MRFHEFVLALLCTTLSGPALAQSFVETFEAYPAGTALEGQGGWQGFTGVNTGLAQVTTTFAESGTRSVWIPNGADSARPLNITSGRWVLSVKTLFPGTNTGEARFSLVNDYDPTWVSEFSVVLAFDGATGILTCGCGTTLPATKPIVTDAWAEILVDIDLDTDLVVIWYDGALIGGYPWSSGNSGLMSFQELHLEALRLRAAPSGAGASEVYYDQIQLRPVIGTNYCPALPNSSGQVSRLLVTGSPLVANNELTLRVDGCVPNVSGIFYFGTDATAVPFGDGVRCVGGLTQRLGFTPTNDIGTATQTLDVAPFGQIVPGASLNFQYWHRDTPAGAGHFNLSDGANVLFQ